MKVIISTIASLLFVASPSALLAGPKEDSSQTFQFSIDSGAIPGSKLGSVTGFKLYNINAYQSMDIKVNENGTKRDPRVSDFYGLVRMGGFQLYTNINWGGKDSNTKSQFKEGTWSNIRENSGDVNYPTNAMAYMCKKGSSGQCSAASTRIEAKPIVYGMLLPVALRDAPLKLVPTKIGQLFYADGTITFSANKASIELKFGWKCNYYTSTTARACFNGNTDISGKDFVGTGELPIFEPSTSSDATKFIWKGANGLENKENLRVLFFSIFPYSITTIGSPPAGNYKPVSDVNVVFQVA